MTSPVWFGTVVSLVADLSLELTEVERYQHFIRAARRLFPCDAVALLRLADEELVPLAVDGLSPDTLGRRFRIAEHPRFAQLLQTAGPYRFPEHSTLPDPYDGLIEALPGRLEVHDCIGCVLKVQGAAWGLLTLDSLQARSFEPEHMGLLDVFSKLVAAAVSAATRIDRLTRRAEDAHQQAERCRRAAGQPERRLLGQSPVFQQLTQEIELVGRSELTVLVTGETGAGKELVARAVHAASPRAAQTLVCLNCAALPDTLVESELFGHVRGAFAGAVADHQGKFELADGGTLFLDEIGELPSAVQAKLLRVLQSGHLQRLGSDRERRVDVRLIAATNRNLAAEVRAGRLRADIYHRLSVYPLKVPALRERGRDVLLLAGFFLEESRSRHGLRGVRLAPEAEARLLRHEWPGNVRELEHLIDLSVLKALGREPGRARIVTLSAGDLGIDVSPAAAPAAQDAGAGTDELGETAANAPAAGLREQVEAFERRLIADALTRHDQNWAAAARELQVDRANLARLARRLGVPPDRSASSRRLAG